MAEELKAAYLLTGSDRPKIERALHRLRDRFGEDSVERLSARGRLPATTRSPPATRWASSRRAAGWCSSTEVERWKARRREGDRRVPGRAGARHRARARRRGDPQGLAAREGVREGRRRCSSYEVSKRELPQVGRGAVRPPRREGRRRRPAARWSSWSATTRTSSRARSTSSRSGPARRRDRRGRGRAARRRAGRRTAVRRSPTLGEGATSPGCSPRASRSSSARPALGRDPDARRPARRARPPRPGVPAPRRRGRPRRATRPRELKMHPFAAEKAFDAGAELLRRRAARGDRRPRRPRPRGQGRQPPAARARAPADAGRDHARPPKPGRDASERRASGPSRPSMPDGYGVPDTDEGLLDWSWAVERLESALNYWFATTRPDGRPHAMPAWAVWLDGGLYFEGSPLTRRARNLAANPAVVVHLESGDEVVILEGEARRGRQARAGARRAPRRGVHGEVRRDQVRVPSAARAVGPRRPLGDAAPGRLRLERVPARHHPLALRATDRGP